MIIAIGAFLAHYLKRRIAPIHFGPVMIDAVLVSLAYFLERRSFIPVMVQTVRPILAYDFLVVRFSSHFVQIANIFFGVSTVVRV